MFQGRPKEYKSRVVFTTSADADLLTKFQEVAAREGKPMNQIIQALMADYIKKHGNGNPSFEITKWVEEPKFKADPAVREGNETWDKYLSQCDKNDLAQLMGTFQVRYNQAKKSWIDKR
jgi:hypothetical protein